MSSRQFSLTAGAKKNTLAGHSYDAKEQLIISPSLSENYTTIQANPVSGGPGTGHRIDINLSNDDEMNIQELCLEFVFNNLDGTVTQTIINPWLLLSEIKILINNQELVYHTNTEQIFCAQASYYRSLSANELYSALQETRYAEYGATFTGDTVAVSSAIYYSLPLISVLFPYLKDISRSNGLYKLSIEWRYQPNVATASGIGRFILSSTTANCYTTAMCSMTNIQARLLTTKHSDSSLRTVPNALMVVNKYEDRMFNISWNATTASQRIQLSNDFSHHRMCHGIQIYIYDQARVTAYNDADACKIFSSYSNIGFELKYKSRSIVKYDNNTSDVPRRVKYHHDVNKRRHNKHINHNLISGGDTSGTYYVPLTFIDLQNVETNDPDIEQLYSGISNEGGELELILTNCVGSFSTSCYLYVVLCYYEIAMLNPKTQTLSYKK